MLTEKELDEMTEEFEAAEAEEVAEEEKNKSDSEEINAGLDEIEEKPEDLSDGSSVWDGLSEDQREEVKALQSQLAVSQHAAASDRGRNKALHAKVKKLEEKAKAEPEKPESNDDDNGYTDEEYADMRKELPEVSAIVERETSDLKKQLSEIEKRFEITDDNDDLSEDLEPQASTEEIEAAKVQYEETLAVHPDLAQVVDSIDYSTWLSKQAQGVRDMADSPSADNAIQVISLFKQSVKPKADLNKELDSMTEQPSKGLTKSNLISEDDFDAQLEAFGEQLDKELQL